MQQLLNDWLSPNGIIALGVIVNIWLVISAKRQALAAAKAALSTAKDASISAASAVNTLLNVEKNMKSLEINTNSKMDALLKAKDDLTLAQVRQATAEGKEAGRIAEVERTKDG